MGKKILLIPALIFGVALSALSQFAIPAIWGADGYLHIRMAQFIRLYGLHYQFHWARYSTFYQHFADKDFLYHILLIPFTFLPDMFWGAKIAACIFVIALFFIFYWVLKRYCLPALSPLFLLLFFFSAPFLRGILEPRPMVLVLALTLLLVHFLIRKNWRGLFFVSLIYTLTHVSGPYLIFYALLAEATRFINERKIAWRSLLAVVLGLLIGVLLHPNFPNNLLVFYINGMVVPYYAMHWGLELGAEFFPLDTRDFVLGYPFILIAVILLLTLGMSRSGKTQLSTKIWMSITGFFFVFSFFSRRYFIHSYPLVLISLGAYLSDWWQSEKRLIWLREFKFSKHSVAFGLVGMLAFFGLHTYKEFRENAISDLVYNRHFEVTAKWMHDNIPPGELIFHTNWSDSQYFIGLNPANDYFVTLDPTYMFCWDKDKYNLYREVSFGKSSDPYVILKNEFKVRYGYAGKNYFSGLITQIRADERFIVLAENDFGVVFKLK